MNLPPSFLDALRLRLSLAEIVGRKVKLVRKGREFSGLCPFHAEKSPSFYVNEEKEFFHCFGCGAHGDVIGFTMRAENIGFMEAIERLAGEAGMTCRRCGRRSGKSASRRKPCMPCSTRLAASTKGN